MKHVILCLKFEECSATLSEEIVVRDDIRVKRTFAINYFEKNTYANLTSQIYDIKGKHVLVFLHQSNEGTKHLRL